MNQYLRIILIIAVAWVMTRKADIATQVERSLGKDEASQEMADDCFGLWMSISDDISNQEDINADDIVDLTQSAQRELGITGLDKEIPKTSELIRDFLARAVTATSVDKELRNITPKQIEAASLVFSNAADGALDYSEK